MLQFQHGRFGKARTNFKIQGLRRWAQIKQFLAVHGARYPRIELEASQITNARNFNLGAIFSAAVAAGVAEAAAADAIAYTFQRHFSINELVIYGRVCEDPEKAQGARGLLGGNCEDHHVPLIESSGAGRPRRR
jgi:hypothetical protein